MNTVKQKVEDTRNVRGKNQHPLCLTKINGWKINKAEIRNEKNTKVT